MKTKKKHSQCVENDVEQQNYILINLMSTLSSRSPQTATNIAMYYCYLRQKLSKPYKYAERIYDVYIY